MLPTIQICQTTYQNMTSIRQIGLEPPKDILCVSTPSTVRGKVNEMLSPSFKEEELRHE